jgi:Methylase of polypeptide chain release factors
MTLLVSNPPYIPIENKNLYKDLHDPKNSLFAKDYGFFEIKNILKQSSEFMKKKAYLILEHSHHHTLQFDQVLKDYKLKKVITERDMYGYDRFTVIKNF